MIAGDAPAATSGTVSHGQDGWGPGLAHTSNDMPDGGARDEHRRETALAALLAGLDPGAIASLIEISGLDRLIGDDDQLRETLRVYLDVGGVTASTSRRLGIDRRTVRNRIKRINERCGLDLGTGTDRLVADLALRALDAHR